MDISRSSLQLQDGSGLLFDCESLLDQSHLMSDAGYYSASLSPTSSIDSCGFSPPAQKVTKKPKKTGRPSSKFPGVKRENASEREKLRMRDLTKALHHLRNYLPPSVAPAGKTLTKIETLRLTIQYISSLSEQLGSGEEEAGRGVSSEETQNEVPSMFVNFSEATSVAQHFQSCCLNTNEDPFQTFQTQNFWIHQQASFFPGQC